MKIEKGNRITFDGKCPHCNVELYIKEYGWKRKLKETDYCPNCEVLLIAEGYLMKCYNITVIK